MGDLAVESINTGGDVGDMDDMSMTSRAAFLATGTADFRPPDWACMPVEGNVHARLEAYRDSRHCATYMISTKVVNAFGRDQDSCDHVLGNPSVSRKHAAIIHDGNGGIYLVDLMSRHGTFVGRTKLPPHDPFLLHDGDIVKFGQSIRVYVLKGACADGASAAVKKSWGRVRLRAPKVSISAVLPKMNSRPKYAASIVKIVNDICYGNMTDAKMDAFMTAVMEIQEPELKTDMADLLIEKVHAKFEFYAAHVHRNAYVATMTLLKSNMLVEEFEANLSTITHLSQQRHDSIYRSNARKILQILAAVRLDPENVHSPVGSVISAEDAANICPPTVNNRGPRERVLSDEGKRLFLAGHGYADPQDGSAEKRATGEYDMPQHSRQGSYGSTQYGDDDDSASQSSGYQPPGTTGPWAGQYGGQNPHGQYNPQAPPANGTQNGATQSAFSFMGGRPQSPAENHRESGPNASAFGFIGSNGNSSELTAPAEPTPPRIKADEFLVAQPTMDEAEFEEIWENCEEAAEWVVELTGAFNQEDFMASLDESRIKFIAREKIAGMNRLLFCAEQDVKETIFLIEVMLVPGLVDMTVTFKRLVRSLIWNESDHELFLELFKYAVHRFCSEPASTSVDGRTDSESAPIHIEPQYESRPTLPVRPEEAVVPTETEDEPWDFLPVLDYLSENAAIEPAKFEQLWAGATPIGTVSIELASVPDKEDVIATFQENRLSCLASGAVNSQIKFYFYGEMLELHCLFSIEMVIDTEHQSVVGTIKRFAYQQRIEEEEEQIDASFIDYFEKAVQSL